MWPPELASEIEFYGMHRADLLAMFVDRPPADIVKAGHRCIGFEQDDRQAVITFANGARATADVVIAADGIHSTLQQFVVAPSDPLYSGFHRLSRRDLGGERLVAARRCATGTVQAGIFSCFRCAPACSSTTSAL
ncbi:2-polyprenyl-6-methoxyphenol hydroxylase-like FAD-dependent oxidoreductase [Inquilinus ginsengisoli]|uniref:hypothetical protein n=1 Tax=Inquilinus ginsengisoli TaxID=363840 RepID=UPI003D1928B3